jgi:hypothetical protein
MGYAIGHYARFIKRGTVRIEATSSDPLLQVTAFRDDVAKRVIVVLINNAAVARRVAASLTTLRLAGNLNGEQSTAAARWQPLVPFGPSDARKFALDLPARSVTTIFAAYDDAPPATATATRTALPPTATLSAGPSATPPASRTATRTAAALPTATLTSSATPTEAGTRTRSPTTRASATPTPTTDSTARRGDANCDGWINAADLPALLERIPDGQSPSCPLADADGSGTIDADDIAPVLRAIFGAASAPS